MALCIKRQVNVRNDASTASNWKTGMRNWEYEAPAERYALRLGRSLVLPNHVSLLDEALV